MTIKDIQNLLKEKEAVELKSSLSSINEIIESVSAFANTKGGKIVIGVDDTGRILGVQIGKGTIENLANRIAQNTEPKVHPKISVKEIDDKEIIVIEVKENLDKLVLAFGRPYKRVGKSSPRMSKDEYEGRILEKHKDRLRFDKEICEGATLKDVNREKVKAFLKKAKTERRLDLDENLPLEEILMRLKLIRDGKLTNAAILLFGKPQDFFLQCEVKCIRFKGTDVSDKMLDLKPIVGNIIDQVLEAENFIFDHIAMSAWIESGKIERQEKWEYPPKAIRESLTNAIAHRDYWSSSKSQVRIFDDRIEFWNPGKLPEGWTVETLRQKHDSIPPNPLIAKQFFWLKYIEEVGTGTNKIIQWCKEWGLPEPDFEYTGTSLVVTLRKSRLTKEYLKTLDLNERQEKAIEYLKEHKAITNREYRMINNIGKVIAVKELNQMTEKNILKVAGKGRASRYELND